MIGHDDENEEVHFKVADKRKFNSDGSLREGVTLEPAKTVAPPVRNATDVVPDEDPALSSEPDNLPHEVETADAYDDGEDIPGAQDPASFVNFLSTIATNAAAALGAVPHPATGQRDLDLDSGKYWLEVLSMLRDKTENNLHPKESRLLEGLLADLRLQYVRLVRATEEKLKAQAAKQFSGDELIGKKV